MNQDQIKRTDFPTATEGYDRDSVNAHLAAVAASLAALEARITSFEVERDALRRQALGSSLAEPEARQAASPETDEVSARLIATKMALDGIEREDIRLKLSASYDLDDLDGLLDDVIERVS